MEIYILPICLSVILLYISLFLRRKTKKIPPGPNGLPILGSLLKLGPLPHKKLAEWSKYYGPLMSVKLGLNTTIVASSAEYAKEILQKHETTCSYRPMVDAMRAIPNSEGLIGWVPADEKWRHKRRIFSSYFVTTKRIESLQNIWDKKVQELIAHIQKHGDIGTPVDIGQLAFSTILNFISNSVFSDDIVDMTLVSGGKAKELIESVGELMPKPNISDLFPALKKFDLQGVRKQVRKDCLSLYEIFDEFIDKRLESRACGSWERNGDLLDVLLDECQKDGTEFNREMIRPMIMELFFAGSDTSSQTIEWTMAELLRNPEIMQKVQEELAQVIGDEELKIKLLDTDKVPYLQAIIKETLRMHPPAPMLLPHMAGNDIKINGFTIEKGNHIMINAWAIGRDPSYWDEPLSFKPERFLNSSIDFKGQNFEYLPFGAGRRICPGWPLAHRMVSTILATIIYSFNWKLPEGISPENLDMQERFVIALKRVTPLCAIPLPK